MDREQKWRQYLWQRFEITPESKYMNLNEMETLICLRDELKWPYQAISYIEYMESIYQGGLIARTIKEHRL